MLNSLYQRWKKKKQFCKKKKVFERNQECSSHMKKWINILKNLSLATLEQYSTAWAPKEGHCLDTSIIKDLQGIYPTYERFS